ncbi:MAG TPA: hypothetical protein VJT10_02465 [Steroidobacteraceae bacterium]|jgi:hypothetical protein|nr:hypothetical protein [Steroidobacteraceae bacterium]
MQYLRAVSLLVFACAWPAQAAEKLPPLDAEFLEYLANFGSDEEDWTLFADEEPAAEPPPAKEPPAKSDASKTEAAAKPAEKR